MAQRQGLLLGRHLSLVQFKATIILEWIDTQAKTISRFERIKMSLIASGHSAPHVLFPKEIEGPKKEISAADPMPDAETPVRYELEAPTDFGLNEYERLMAEIGQLSNGSVTGDQMSNDGWM